MPVVSPVVRKANVLILKSARLGYLSTTVNCARKNIDKIMMNFQKNYFEKVRVTIH
jgi:hypothetical protein